MSHKTRSLHVHGLEPRFSTLKISNFAVSSPCLHILFSLAPPSWNKRCIQDPDITKSYTHAIPTLDRVRLGCTYNIPYISSTFIQLPIPYRSSLPKQKGLFNSFFPVFSQFLIHYIKRTRLKLVMIWPFVIESNITASTPLNAPFSQGHYQFDMQQSELINLYVEQKSNCRMDIVGPVKSEPNARSFPCNWETCSKVWGESLSHRVVC